MDYSEFLTSKTIIAPTAGVRVDDGAINPILFPFQRDMVRWAVRKGRAAIFADTGLGKTFMQLEWARLTGERTLILAPLAVARQTIAEGAKLGITVTYARNHAQSSDGITITNYEMLPHFDPTQFGAVVLDESSILKSFEGKTRTALIEAFAETPYRLCCTATPAPNDIAEIANHAEFLGIMSRTGMLATFFVHDDDGWRLKRHARQPFYRWMASWGMSLKRPSDIGYDDAGYDLPPLTVEPVIVESDYTPEGMLFATELKGITHRSGVRKATLAERVQRAADLIAADDQPWIAWCGLNEEARLLGATVPGAVNVEGSQSPEEKAERLAAFARGETRVLVTKSSIAGFGLNFQHCARMVFVGINDSYESYYQAIRRCWRYGQTRPVNAYIVLSDVEMPIYHNVLRKEEEAARMSDDLIKHVAEFEREEILKAELGTFEYAEDEASGEKWRLLLGDSVERINEIPDDSIDLSVFSPPFQSLYTYSATERDLGNSASRPQFWQHFGYIIDGLLRVTKPGRNVAVHCMDLPTTLLTQGVIGLEDFRGQTVAAFQEHGFTWHGVVTIDKDPQAQAIRTHAKGLLFVQLRKDASWLRPALADYILVFRKPGDNAVPVTPDITNEDWIEWARPIWYGIRESDTLNTAEARSVDDERHIAPLQLGTIERCVRLWSNPGETVFSPFAGIGSEGYQSLLSNRRFIGIELNPKYWQTAVRNLKRAEDSTKVPTLFEWAPAE